MDAMEKTSSLDIRILFCPILGFSIQNGDDVLELSPRLLMICARRIPPSSLVLNSPSLMRRYPTFRQVKRPVYALILLLLETLRYYELILLLQRK